jgi:molybdopterin-guanine dinucleotide biosynthesis protein A
LAGGAGRRIGGDKAVVALAGRPLVQWVIDAVSPVTGTVAVVAKTGTLLPHLDPGVSLWLETEPDFHPLLGVVHALTCARGRPVLVVAGDMPLLTTEVLTRLAEPSTPGSNGRIASVDGRLQPLCARYEPGALAALSDFDRNARTTDTALALGVDIVEFDDALPFFNINAPEDLLTAGAELKRRSTAD